MLMLSVDEILLRVVGGGALVTARGLDEDDLLGSQGFAYQ